MTVSTRSSPTIGPKSSNKYKQAPISSVNQHSDFKKLENPQSTSSTKCKHNGFVENKQDFSNEGKRIRLGSGFDKNNGSSKIVKDKINLKTPMKLKKNLEVIYFQMYLMLL